MSEWIRYYVDLLDHQRIAEADLTHLPAEFRDVMREAMHNLYWRAVVTLQKQRSDDGEIGKFAVWGPGEARRSIAEELVRAGMLEPREGGRYYPRNYLEKNRRGQEIRAAAEATATRQGKSRARKRSSSDPPPPLESESHALVTRDAGVAPVSLSGSGSEEERESHQSPRASETRVRASAEDDTPERLELAAPLSDEYREAAKMIGVQDHENAWLKFKGEYSEERHTRLGWSGKWQKWCGMERNFEAKSRVTSGSVTRDSRDPPRAPYHSDASKLLKQHERDRREAVGPPPDLLARIEAGA